MSNGAQASPTLSLLPADIVAIWKSEISTALGDWSLHANVFNKYEPLLKNQIQMQLNTGRPFTAEALSNSLQVARDIAAICKILQPKPHGPLVVSLDTYEIVHHLCATQHQTCKNTGGGAGGWCDV